MDLKLKPACCSFLLHWPYTADLQTLPHSTPSLETSVLYFYKSTENRTARLRASIHCSSTASLISSYFIRLIGRFIDRFIESSCSFVVFATGNTKTRIASTSGIFIDFRLDLLIWPFKEVLLSQVLRPFWPYFIFAMFIILSVMLRIVLCISEKHYLFADTLVTAGPSIFYILPSIILC